MSPSVTEFTGEIFVLLGRLSAIPRHAAVREIESHHGTVRRGLTRRSSYLVIGHGACEFIGSERLSKNLDKAKSFGVACISENTFLRMLGRLEPLDISERSIPLNTLSETRGLDTETVWLLTVFDVVEPVDGQCSFRELVAAKEAARLLSDGISLGEVVTSLTAVRRLGGAGASLSQFRLAPAEAGGVNLIFGGSVADLDGQLRLPFSETKNPSVDEIFEAAESAEDAGQFEVAEVLYRQCVFLDKSDPIARFNLANVLREQDQPKDARLFLELALSLDAKFVEAWYNLADLADVEGDVSSARKNLQKALDADEGYADALYNIADLEYQCGNYLEAMKFWERYIALDEDSEWTRKARDGISLCRQQML